MKLINMSIIVLVMIGCVPPNTQENIAHDEYNIVSIKDIGFIENGVKIVRTEIRVSLNNEKSELSLKRISKKIITDITNKTPQNAVSILYYLPGFNTSSYYTAGMVEWAPFGNWDKANLIATGDYSHHNYTVKVGGLMGKVVEPKNSNLSLSKRKEIYYNLIKLQDTGYDSRKSYTKIAQQYGIEEKLVKEIVGEGLTKGWPMP